MLPNEIDIIVYLSIFQHFFMIPNAILPNAECHGIKTFLDMNEYFSILAFFHNYTQGHIAEYYNAKCHNVMALYNGHLKT
jgi:hypothetical protein